MAQCLYNKADRPSPSAVLTQTNSNNSLKDINVLNLDTFKGVFPENIIFSDLVGKNLKNYDYNEEIEFSKRYFGPENKEVSKLDKIKKPGLLPITTLLHEKSHRERKDSDDDGVDETNSIKIRTKSPSRKKSSKSVPKIRKIRGVLIDNIQIAKGEFIFPHKTYKPKVQIAHRTVVPVGQLSQAVAVERLHRLYKNTDINVVCKKFGIEKSDLIPPPNYGETSERFYEEAMLRNRIKIFGYDKKEYILSHFPNNNNNNAGDNLQLETESKISNNNKKSELIFNDEKQETNSVGSGDSSESSEKLLDPLVGDFGEVHPLTKSKIPFDPSLPLDFFDNEDYDIRSGEEWIDLGWDESAEKRYAIPGKAFLPIPIKLSTNSQNSKSISELTAEYLLLSTPKLEKFRNWLLKERERRHKLMMGQHSGFTGNEDQLEQLARLTSTISSFIHVSDKSQSSLINSKKSGTTFSDITLQKIYSGEEPGEVSGASSEISLNLRDSNFLEELQKHGGIYIDPNKRASIEEVLEEVKRSESLLSDIFSDPNSQILSPEAMSLLKLLSGLNSELASEDISKTEFGESKIDLDDQNELKSPNIDPLEDGFTEFVYDFDKMKKVHIYDWKWAEVAVFNYNSEKRKYLVRTIYPPHIYAWIGKLYLLFDAENPKNHGRRMADAILERIHFEQTMRYNLYLDCLPIVDASEMVREKMQILFKKAFAGTKLSITPSQIQIIEKMTDLEYKRSEMKLQFDNIVNNYPRLFKPWVQIPDSTKKHYWENEEEWKNVNSRKNDTKNSNFCYKVISIQKASVLFSKEPYGAIIEIIKKCEEMKEMKMILTNIFEPLYVEEYESIQNKNMEEVALYCKDVWIESIIDIIRKHLNQIPKSWYNIEESKWDIYNISKTKGFLTVIKFIMEDSLRFLVEDSLEDYVKEIEILTSTCYYSENYEWGEDLKNSEFPPPKLAKIPFKLDLIMDKHGVKFTQFLGSFQEICGNIFNNIVEKSSNLPNIIPLVMKNLLFGTTLKLASVDQEDKKIVELRRKLFYFLRKGLIPVDCYAQKYKKYLHIIAIDANIFLRDWENENHTSTETKKEVEMHLQEIKQLKMEIPNSIDISAFRINTHLVKENLIKRKKEIYIGILNHYAFKLRKQITAVLKEYREIERKLKIRSDDIREVMELKSYLEDINGKIYKLDEIVSKVMKDYEIFDKFAYLVPNSDVEAKWNAALYAKTLIKLTEDSVSWLEEDYERLLRVQQSDLSDLSDAVGLAALSITGLIAYVELDKAPEVSSEVEKIWRHIKELEEQNNLLNKRQEIFGLVPSQNEALMRLLRDIEPFKNFWFVAADMLKIKDMIYKETLDKIDVDLIVKVIIEDEREIEKCIEYFKELDSMTNLGMEIRHQISQIKPLVPILATLKNTGMRQRHWEACTLICGFIIVGKGNQTFKKLLDEGIHFYSDQIAEIGELATKEYEIEKLLDKMEKSMENYFLELEFDEELNMNFVKYNPNNALEIVEEYVQITDELAENPYTNPFEERLRIWSKKIHGAKQMLNTWIFYCQKQWRRIQITLHSNPQIIDEIKSQNNSNFKNILKLERIWKRLCRQIKESTEILKVVTNPTINSGLVQFSSLIEKASGVMEVYERPVF